MRTVVETPTFQKQAQRLWTEDERMAFVCWIAANPQAGDVIPQGRGVRKVRWARAGSGKSGGVRVIYFNRLECGEVWLLALYAKSDKSTMPAHETRGLL